jgi:hypothetical protein
VTPGGEADRWYWAAPLLLDKASARFSKVIKGWFAKKNAATKESNFEYQATEATDEKGAK